MSHPKKLTYAALAATLTLLLGACGQTDVAAANSPTPTLTAVRSTGTAPIPFDTFGRTPAGSRQTFQAQAAAQDIARIQIFPPTASLADGGTATFYAEAFDAAGHSLGNIDYADLTVSQVAPQTGAVIESGSTSTGFRVTVPAGQYDNRTLVVALKDQPTVRSQIDLATVALQPGVINLSDGNIQFPKVTTDYSRATEAQVAAELAPFTLSEYIGAFPAQANQLNSPFVLQSSVPLHVGDLIHISHSGSTFGRIATVQVKGDLYLITLGLTPASDVIKDFVNYLDTTTTSEGARLQPTALTAQQTGSPGSCAGQGPLINLGKIEFEQIDAGKAQMKPKFTAGFNLDLNTELSAECVLESTPVYSRFSPYISFGFSMRNYAKLTVEGTVNGRFGSGTTLTGNIFEPATLSVEHTLDGTVDLLGGGIDGVTASSKGTAELGIAGRLHIIPFDAWLQSKAAQVLKFFGANRSGSYVLAEVTADLSFPVSVEGEFLSSRKAFDEDDGSSITAKASVKIEAGFGGVMSEIINSWGLNLPIVSGEWVLQKEKSETPKLLKTDGENPKVTDKDGSADIEMKWDKPLAVRRVILGDINHDTRNSLHEDTLDARSGTVEYNIDQCKSGEITAKILGYGAMLWKGNPMTFFGDLPFSNGDKVKVCSPKTFVSSAGMAQFFIAGMTSDFQCSLVAWGIYGDGTYTTLPYSGATPVFYTDPVPACPKAPGMSADMEEIMERTFPDAVARWAAYLKPEYTYKVGRIDKLNLNMGYADVYLK